MANGKYTKELDDLDIEVPHDDFSLYLDVRDTGFAAINAISYDWGIGHIVFFANAASNAGTRECRVYRDEPNLHQVCKSIAGATALTGTCSDATGYCKAYRLVQ